MSIIISGLDVETNLGGFGTSERKSVRAATTLSGTLSTSFVSGNSIDGVVLALNDRILIKNQVSSVENGIYIVQGSGAPLRAGDVSIGDKVSSISVLIEEGGINADTEWTCTNDRGSDVVATDGLAFVKTGGIDTVSGPASTTDNALVRWDGTDGRVTQTSGAILNDTNDLSGLAGVAMSGDLNIYDANNDGNPIIALGAAPTESFEITAVYTGGTQLLDKVTFETKEVSGTANKGKMEFLVDEVLKVTIDDGGVDLASGNEYEIAGTSVLSGTTLGSGVTSSSLTSVGTIGTGTWQGTAVAPTYGGTGQDTSSATGAASVSSGTWSVGTLSVANGGTGAVTHGSNNVLLGAGTGAITSTKAAPTGDFVGTTDTQTLSSKTFTLPEINDTTADHQYVFGVSELAADRTVTLPLLTTADEFVFKDHAVTLTNKTMDGGSNTFTNIDHGTQLTGLGDDDHTQYALLAGRSGGQTLIGGTASGDDLILQSTSNGTKGNVQITEETESTNMTSGALIVTGGVGIAKRLNAAQVTVDQVDINNGVVTYSGATGNNQIVIPDNLADALSIQEGATKYITFETTDSDESINVLKSINIASAGVPVTPAEGDIYYDTGEDALIYYPDITAVPISIGQETVTRVNNGSGGTLTKGTVVYIIGNGSGVPTVDKAKADVEGTAVVAGIVAADILNATEGYIISYGFLDGVATTGTTAGDVLYLSETTAGEWTVTKPPEGNQISTLGHVVTVGASNRIFVSIQNIGSITNSGLIQSLLGTIWASGLEITENGVPDDTVDYTAGTYYIHGFLKTVTPAGNYDLASVFTALSSGEHAIVTIYVDTDESIKHVTGTPVSGNNKAFPATFPADSVCLAEIDVKKNKAEITDEDIMDCRFSVSNGVQNSDELLKVSVNDTTPKYLIESLSSTGGTITYSTVNPGGDEDLNLEVSIALDDVTDVDTTTQVATTSDNLRWDGSNWTPIVNKFDGTTAPTVNDDVTTNYEVGSRWIDVTNDKEYVCLDPADGAAVWTETTGGGGGGGAPVGAQYITLATDATLTNERVLVAGTGLDLTDAGAGGNATLDIDSTVATLAGTQTLTNKTISDATNTVGANELRTTGASVTIDTAAPPTTGQVLKSTGATAATWQPVKPEITAGGADFSTTNSSYSTAFALIYGGSTNNGTITGAHVIIRNDGTSTMDVRLQDVTNSNTIAEVTGEDNANSTIVDLGTISNIPTGQAILELQIARATSSGNPSIYATFVAVEL